MQKDFAIAPGIMRSAHIPAITMTLKEKWNPGWTYFVTFS